MEYIIKDEVAEQVRKDRRNREIARILGLTEGYISQLIHKRPVKTKLLAFGMAKAINKELEVEDVFDIFE